MEEKYHCIHCDHLSDDKNEFGIDLSHNVDEDKLICNECYERAEREL